MLAAGCAPTCGEVCGRLESCDLLGSVTWIECRDTCDDKVRDLAAFESTALEVAFQEERRCIGGSSCEAIAEGTCFDPSTASYEVE